jgi:hypothetical protein
MLLANVIGDLVAIFIFKSLILVAIASILLLLLVFGWECTFSIKNFPYHTKQFYKWCRIYISLFNKLTHNRYERLVKNTKQFQIMSYHNNINPFENYSGSMNLSKPGIFASLSIVGLLVVKLGIIGIILVFALTIWGCVLYYLFCYPIIGFIPPSL